MASFSTCVLGISLFLYKSNSIKNTKELIVYNIKDEVAIDIFHGDKNLFISSDSLINNEDKMLFNIKHHWFHKTGMEDPVEWQNVIKLKRSVLQLNSKTLSLCDEMSAKYLTDFVIVSDLKYLSNYILKKWKSNRTTIIIHPKVNYNVKQLIFKGYPKELIYDIKKSGAFILAF